MVAPLACGQRRNPGADLRLNALAPLVGGNAGLYTLPFGLFSHRPGGRSKLSAICFGAEMDDATLFTYVGVVMVAHVPWPRALRSLVVPELQWNIACATALVAILAQRSVHICFSGVWPGNRRAASAPRLAALHHPERGWP